MPTKFCQDERDRPDRPPRRRALLAWALLGLASVWVQAQPAPVRMVATDFPPYTAENLPGQGVAVAIARAALASQGLKLQVVFRPWARALLETERGEHDGLLGVWYQAERERYLLFTKPIGVNNLIVLFGAAATPRRFDDLAALRGLSIGVVQGYANPPRFDEAVKELNLSLQPVRDDATNLRKLLAGRIDLVLIDKGVARYILDRQMPQARTQLRWQEPPVAVMPLYIGVAKAKPGAAQLRDSLDLGLQAIGKNGELARILQDFSDLL